MDDFEYKVALPAPTLYAQYNNIDDTGIVLRALLELGFDDVYEVAAGAEMVSEISRKYIAEHGFDRPFISTACPSVVRLIRVRFPNLLERLLPISSPMDVAAKFALRRAIERTGLAREKIGIFFISPCPAKNTSVKSPIAIEKSEVDRVLAIKDIYPLLLPHMKETDDIPTAAAAEISASGKIGVSWSKSGGECGGLLTDNYLAADGIENVIHVLEDLEDCKISNLDFVELNACPGGCVGGTLNVENPYVARAKINRLRKYLPVTGSHVKPGDEKELFLDSEIEYLPVFRIGDNMKDSIRKMSQIDEILNRLPCLDCGACGAPSCKALAEDVVMGRAEEKDCIYKNRNQISEVRSQNSDLSSVKN
jgi:iron only hydrogenase large subunit-like protein